jgi:hypothetical protein
MHDYVDGGRAGGWPYRFDWIFDVLWGSGYSSDHGYDPLRDDKHYFLSSDRISIVQFVRHPDGQLRLGHG